MNFRLRGTSFSVSWGIWLTGASTVWKVGLGLNCPVWGNADSGFRNILLVESGILSFGMRNIAEGIQNSTNDWNSGVQNPSSTKKNGINYLESGIQGVESRIQDCLNWIPLHGQIWMLYFVSLRNNLDSRNCLADLPQWRSKQQTNWRPCSILRRGY